MTDHTAGRHTREARQVLAALDAPTRPITRDPWEGNDFPEHPRAAAMHAQSDAVAAVPPRPVENALAYADDRLDRLEHTLNSTMTTINRLADLLTPVLTGGTYGRVDAPGSEDPRVNVPTVEDRRSTIAKRIGHLGDRADRLADRVNVLERELEDLIDATEL